MDLMIFNGTFVGLAEFAPIHGQYISIYASRGLLGTDKKSHVRAHTHILVLWSSEFDKMWQ